jgi:ribosome biogenesis GTPase A
MTIQWFPGHMAKTIKQIKKISTKIDIVLEVIDARIPLSSRNPILDELFPDKPRLLLFNKVDLSNLFITNKWIAYFKSKNIPAISINALSGKETNKIETAIKKLANVEKKITNCVVFGIPNVGKSSLINYLIGQKKVIVGNRPGVTKKEGWIIVGKNIMILDTPGILWPKFENISIGYKLAIANCIKEERYDFGEIATYLCNVLLKDYPFAIKNRFKIEDDEQDPAKIFERIGQYRGCFVSGNEIDLERVYQLFLREFRAGKMGRISLEKPEI